MKPEIGQRWLWTVVIPFNHKNEISQTIVEVVRKNQMYKGSFDLKVIQVIHYLYSHIDIVGYISEGLYIKDENCIKFKYLFGQDKINGN